jgi:hypothetical protein
MATATEAQLLDDLNDFLTRNPSPHKYLGAGFILAPAKIEDILASTPRVQLTAEQQAPYDLAVAQTLAPNVADDTLRKAAEDASGGLQTLIAYTAYLLDITIKIHDRFMPVIHYLQKEMEVIP